MLSGNIYGFRSRDDFLRSYEVDAEPLGVGGFGTVFPGIRKVDKLEVAIKRVPLYWNDSWSNITSDDSPAVPKELELLHRAQSCPGVIRLYDSCRDESGLVIVMERNDNAQDLMNYIEENGVPDLSQSASILRQIVTTLHHLQMLNIFHRDVKLENILYDDATGKTKLIDFGCAEETVSSNEIFTEYFGTPDHIPPEFLHENSYSPEPATVWSVGCVAYSLVFGHRPFKTKEDIMLHRLEPYDEAVVPKNVRDFIMDCLKPNPEERPSLTSLLLCSFLSDEVKQDPTEKHSKFSEASQSTESSTISLSPEDQSFEIERAVHSKTSISPKDYTSGEIILEEIYEECEDSTESLTNFDQAPDNELSYKRKRYMEENFDCDSNSPYKITRNH